MRLCGKLDIEYVHIPELGIASEERRALGSDAAYEVLFNRYERTTLVDRRDLIERVASLVQEKPSVLVCMESDPSKCHRARLAVPVSDCIGLPIVHLRPEQ
jgi:uncharacterized protein (DUF488 family)